MIFCDGVDGGTSESMLAVAPLRECDGDPQHRVAVAMIIVSMPQGLGPRFRRWHNERQGYFDENTHGTHTQRHHSWRDNVLKLHPK